MPTQETSGLTLEPDRSSRHQVGIRASPAEVYQALTDPGHLSRWFVSEASIDLRQGGAYRWVFGEATGSPGPDPLVAAGTFVTLVPHELLRLRAIVEEIETDLEFRLDPWRDGAILTVTHSGFPGEDDWDDTFRSIDQGWASEIQILKLYLEKARGMVRRSFFHEARLAATAESLFERFTTSYGLGSWLAERAAADPAPGGGLRLEWDGRPPIDGRFVIYEPDHFLAMTLEAEKPSVVRVFIGESGAEAACELRLEHRCFSPDPASFSTFDWEFGLARLAEAISRSPAT
ncbi:MAG TPA: SRPBCC family protein [Candidatus Polarisedimenticolia bacterium]|nr:SRPBCC family protein [Candidatus Polarisedimenticolia bacterium]